MSTNKIMALIGNILYTLNAIVALIVGFSFLIIASLASNTSYQSFDDKGNLIASGSYSSTDVQLGFQFVAVILAIVAVILLVTVVVNWFAFAKMEGPHGRGWRIYLLVIGILSVFDFFAGVFFILAFALKNDKEKVSAVS